MSINPTTGRKILSLKVSKPKPEPPKPEKSQCQLDAERFAQSKVAAIKWLRSLDVIRECKPLKIGIHKDVVKLRPEGVSYNAAKLALVFHVKSKKYRSQVDGNDATVQRYNLDGSLVEKIDLE